VLIPVEPGFKKVKIAPHFGDLSFTDGTFPTLYGVIKVKHVRQNDGSVKSNISLPEGVVQVNN
jgi:hypothetical protein